MNYEQVESVRRIWNLADYLKSSAGDVGMSRKDIAAYSIMTAARQRHSRGPLGERFDGLEAECHRELEKRYGPTLRGTSFYVPKEVLCARTMGTIPGSKGGYLVDTSIASFIDQLQNASVCFASGAQLLTHTEQGNVSVTKQLTGPTFTWLGPPGSSASATDPTFGQIPASPKTIVALTEISEQVERQGGPVAEAFLRRQLALGLAAGADQAILVGAGGTQPLGITNTPNINTVVGTSLDRAKSIDMQKQSVDANAIVTPDAQGYVTTPTIAALLANRQEFAGVATTLWAGSIAKGQIVGVPARSTKGMTAGSVLFGDFSQVALVEFGPMQIAVNLPDTGFNRGVLAVRALWMVDVLITEPKSFTLAASVT